MIRPLLVTLMLTGCATQPAEKPADEYRIVECGTDKVVLFKDTESPDKRYALGWMLHPKSKATKPVNWSSWDKSHEGLSPFLERYPTPDIAGPDSPYELSNAVIDLQTKNLLPLPSDMPYWPGRNRGHVDVLWSPVSESSRHALIQSDARFHTHHLWLVTMESDDMRQVDLAPRVHDAVG